MRNLIFIPAFLILAFSASGQTQNKEGLPKPGKIRVMGRAYKDSILLRWAATTPGAWSGCNKYGVRVERYTMYRDGKALPAGQRDKKILAEKMLPWPEAQWEPLADKSQIALAAALALYGTSLEVSPKGKSDIMEMVNMAQEIENRHGIALLAADQSAEVATASALRLKDKEVKPNEKYLYRVYALLPSNVLKIDTGFVFVDASERFEIPKPKDLKAEFEDKAVKLSWNRIYYESIFSGYIVERSDDDGKTFKKLDNSIFVNVVPDGKPNPDKMYRVDSLPVNNKKFVYRVRGVTPFGEISLPSDPVEGTGKDKVTFVNPNISEVINKNNKEIIIRWKYPSEYESKIKGFVLSRAKSTDSVFKDIVASPLPPNIREFTDPKPGKVNYYQVRAIDLSGNIASSFPAYGQLIDSIPPMSPVGLSGKIDSNGIVTLKWKKGKDEDLFGYRIYRGNSLNEEFTQVTHATFIDTVYKDTIETKTLTKKVFYKIMALDENYNASGFSAILELKRPDKFPPAPPRFKNVLSSDTGIFIQWNHSPSNDVVKELLYRRDASDKTWVLIAISDTMNRINSYTDRELVKGKIYYYTLIAVDDSKLESEPESEISGRMIDNFVRPAITRIQQSVDYNTQTIILKWSYPEKAVKSFVIYRSENDEPYRIYKSLTSNLSELNDKNLKVSSVYKYRIKASFIDGAQSELSEEIVIKY